MAVGEGVLHLLIYTTTAIRSKASSKIIRPVFIKLFSHFAKIAITFFIQGKSLDYLKRKEIFYLFVTNLLLPLGNKKICIMPAAIIPVTGEDKFFTIS
jgi:hypothetical protein